MLTKGGEYSELIEWDLMGYFLELILQVLRTRHYFRLLTNQPCAFRSLLDSQLKR